jgi:hypothetical protein
MFLSIGQFAIGGANRMVNFSIHHCIAQECITARGEEGFLNYTGRLISASHVTLEVHDKGRRQLSYDCTDFHADLISDFYVCDNRGDHRGSLTIDDTLKIEKY